MKISPTGQRLSPEALQALQERLSDTRDFARNNPTLSTLASGHEKGVHLFDNVFAAMNEKQTSVVFGDATTGLFSSPQKLLSEEDYAKLPVMGIEVGLASPALPPDTRGQVEDKRVFSRDNSIYTISE